MNGMKRIFLLLLLALPCVFLRGQSRTVQVVTKTVEEQFKYRSGYEVAVEGEKAEIFVETWDKPYITVRLELTAKHASLEVAKRELDQVQFVAEQVKNKIYLRNYQSDKNHKVASVLVIHYYITLPEECPVYVKNYFGVANISNLKNRLRIFGEYSQINIDNVQGLLDIRTRFGDILGEKIDGNVTINARRSDITLDEIGGSFTINAQYGVLTLKPTLGLRDLQISAEKSEVHLIDPTGNSFGYLLTSAHGQLNIPRHLRITELESTADIRRLKVHTNRREAAPIITVSVTFGDLYIEQQERELDKRKFQ